ncbi:MAG: hypothetical protein RL398_761, partial [Planctomycetota bacterium]
LGRRGDLELLDEARTFAKGSPRIGPAAPDRMLGDVVVADAGAIEGLVVDERGAPVAGVKMAARLEPTFGMTSSCETDASGRFRLTRLFAGEWTVRTATPKFLPTATQVTLDVGESKAGVEIQLRQGAAISGRVVDDLGGPVAGCRVAAQRREERGGMRIERFATDEAATTDANGMFTLAGLAGETATIRAFGGGHTECVATNVPVGSGDVLLKVQRLGVIAGVLVAEDGTPIEGSAISVRPGDGTMEEQIGFGDGEGLPLLAGRATAKSAADGSFRLQGVAPGKLTVLANGKGHRPARHTGLNLTPGQEIVGLRVVAQAGASVLLTVVDQDGKPVAEAAVTARRPSAAPAEGGGAVFRARAVGAGSEDDDVHVFGGDEVLAKGTTDAQGTVLLSALPSGAVEFAAKSERLADAVPLQLQLPTAGRVEGRLQMRTPGFAEVTVFAADGSAAAGAQFVVEGPLGTTSSPRQMVTDDTGKSRVGPLVAGDYRAVLLRSLQPQSIGGAMVFVGGENPELPGSERRFLVGAGETTMLDLRRPLMVALQGRVLGAEGPLPGCEVSLDEDNGDAPQIPGLGGRSTTTDGEGRYRFDEVAPGRVTLRYGPRNAVAKAKQIVDVVGDRAEQEQDLPLRTGTVRVQVLAQGQGTPVGGAMVELQEHQSGAGGQRTERRVMIVGMTTAGDGDGAEASTITLGDSRVRTGADGWATIDNVPVGTYDVVVTHAKFVKGRVDEQVVLERQVTEAGRVELRAAGTIKGTVVAANGSPVPFAMVECAPVAGGNADTQPAMRGNFRFEELSPGRYRVRARSAGLDGTPPGDWGEPSEVEVVAGEAALATVKMPAK